MGVEAGTELQREQFLALAKDAGERAEEAQAPSVREAWIKLAAAYQALAHSR